MVRLLDERQNIYNDTLQYLRTLEKEGRAIVIAPTKPINISRFEKNIESLEELYKMGMNDAKNVLPEIQKVMQEKIEQLGHNSK